jgi:hypothetical protein
VHVLARGRIQASGGPELAVQLEADGYAAFVHLAEGGETVVGLPGPARPRGAPRREPADPFADPLA